MHYVVVLKCYQKRDRHFDRACYTFFKVSARIFCEFAVKLKVLDKCIYKEMKIFLHFSNFHGYIKLDTVRAVKCFYANQIKNRVS